MQKKVTFRANLKCETNTQSCIEKSGRKKQYILWFVCNQVQHYDKYLVLFGLLLDRIVQQQSFNYFYLSHK